MDIRGPHQFRQHVLYVFLELSFQYFNLPLLELTYILYSSKKKMNEFLRNHIS
jgi:hypothetical protein